jgi:hypothetical protein
VLVLAALVLTAAPDWADAAQKFPDLGTFAPARLPDGTLWVRLGGRCHRAASPITLGEGTRNGHVWHWTFDVALSRGAVTLTGPSLVHGFDKPGDTRTFKNKPAVRKLFAGPAKDDAVPLFARSFTLDVECWGTDGSELTCGGKKVSCKRCSVLRLVGEPRGAQHTFGDGVIHADLTGDCSRACQGPGLIWSDFEALKSFVARTPVIDLQAEPEAWLFRSEAACAASDHDLAPGFAPVEPKVP